MHISIIDDEKILVNKVMKKLWGNGYATSAYYSYEDFMRRGNADSQLYIVDLSLGDGSGFDIIRWLRENRNSHVPIIMVSGHGDSQNIIYGLELGADDYLIKPLVPEELMARIKAMLRRPNNFVSSTIITYKNLVFDIDTKMVKIGDIGVHLAKKESLILELFLTNQGKILTREQLVTSVWGGGQADDITDNTINATISKVRKKLSGNFTPKTIYNHGYVLD